MPAATPVFDDEEYPDDADVSEPSQWEQDMRGLLCCTSDDHTVDQGGHYVNVVQTGYPATSPHVEAIEDHTAGEVPSRTALAVLCDRCIEAMFGEGYMARPSIQYVVAGFSGDDGKKEYSRVRVEDL